MKVWELYEALVGVDLDALVEVFVSKKNSVQRTSVLSAQGTRAGGGSHNYPAFVLKVDRRHFLTVANRERRD